MQTRSVGRCAVWLVVIVIAHSVGCSRDGLDSSVSGKVTLDGRTIGPGVVVFAPVGGKTNPATGMIQSNGSYSMNSNRLPGLDPGKYQVSVAVREVPASVAPGERPPLGKLLTPEKYASSTTSGLEFVVLPGRNAIDLPLTSK